VSRGTHSMVVAFTCLGRGCFKS